MSTLIPPEHIYERNNPGKHTREGDTQIEARPLCICTHCILISTRQGRPKHDPISRILLGPNQYRESSDLTLELNLVGSSSGRSGIVDTQLGNVWQVIRRGDELGHLADSHGASLVSQCKSSELRVVLEPLDADGSG